jgi:hypothetical protein
VTVQQILNLKGLVIFQDGDRFYRRVVGGLGWPAPPSPGCLVVLGEELLPDEGLKTRRLWVLGDRQAEGLEDLHRQALSLRKYYQAHQWVAAAARRPELVRWRLANNNFPEEARLHLQNAMHAGEPGLVLSQLIDNLVLAHRKTLFFGPDYRRLAQDIQALQTADLKQAVDRFPALAALGYAAAELTLYEPMGAMGKQSIFSKWDPYTMEMEKVG